MYESPLTLIEKQISMDIEKKIDGEIWKTVREIGIDVDKEELVKALKYDRDQYEKGYRDAKDRYFRVGHWVEEIDSDCVIFGDYILPRIKCSCCDYVPWDRKDCNYCPNCGARMEGTEE